MADQDAESLDLKSTLFLPKTEFPMRAGLPKREPEWLERWAQMGLYRRMREESAGREVFSLHDGPPYANGNLHIGHALNKILKDVVVRSHQMLGYDSRYIPGWDCHGLPIEWKIEEAYRKKGKNKDDVPLIELRGECRDFAAHWLGVQSEEFQRLGVIGDWENRYATMDFRSEALIVKEFHKFVMNGTLYRGSKPVMWSPIEKTALAEAEVEYKEHQSHMIWVKFPIIARKLAERDGDAPPMTANSTQELGDLHGVNVLIWTTTPWTIPQNRAICFNERISYGLYEVTDAPEDNWAKTGTLILLADALAEGVFAAARVTAYERKREVKPAELNGVVCAHPFAGHVDLSQDDANRWDYAVPMLPGDHVTDDAGTGFVHTAPSHGADDYVIGLKNNLPMTYNVGPAGEFREDLPFFGGLHILDRKGKEGKANAAVIDKLVEVDALLARGRLKHSYPHSWRSKAPLIFRNTPQWFVAMDKPIEDDTPANGKTLRARALESIDRDVRWVPTAGRNRLHSMIESRPDWVLSRQRAWGVPLACFIKETGNGEVEILRDPAVNERIVAAFTEEGADAWFEEGAKARFLGTGYDPEEWIKVDDILDVWFESGSTHAFVMEDRDEGIWPASMYLEGTDQHRGWFHSSLLEACATRGRAPYDCVLTHGFTLDEKGEKMSKSVGNTIAPQNVIKEYGADILRLWVMQTDYSEDQRIGPTILKGTADSYRRLRNTFRFLLGALDGFDEGERVDLADMPELERVVLHRLAELDAEVARGYRDFDFQKLFQSLFTFATVDLSAFYFDIRKDTLYCDAPDSLRRRACRTVLDMLFHRLTVWLSPMLCFTMEDVWLSRFPDDAGSVHLQTRPETPTEWKDEALAAKWTMIRRARRVVTGALEIARRDKVIGASLEAAPVLYVADEAALAALGTVSFADMCITSDITIKAGDGPADAFRLDDAPGLAVVFARAEGTKCDRCWKVLPDVGTHPTPGVCGRCDSAVREV